jgi:acetyl-CoA C-acetyltransferase
VPQPVIVAGARTPIGKLLGALAPLTAPQLAGAAIAAALERAGITAEQATRWSSGTSFKPTWARTRRG